MTPSALLRRTFSCLGLVGVLLALAPISASAQTGGTCCLCQRASTGSNPAARGYFTIPAPNNCGNATQSTAVSSGHSAADLQGISCSDPGASCPNPQPATGLYSALTPPVAVAPETETAAPTVPPIIPQLAVPIPGLTFGDPTLLSSDNGTFLVIPFLAQYISAVYRYLVGIAALVAVIMVIYGSFLWIIGTIPGDYQRAKSIIRDAVAGLLILLSSYAILYTINPATLNLKGLQLKQIDRDTIDEELRNNQNPTLGEETLGGGGSGAGGQPATIDLGSLATAGTGQLIVNPNGAITYSDCPVQMSDTPLHPGRTVPVTSRRTGELLQPNDARWIEFSQKMTPLISNLYGRRECVVIVAAASAKCRVHGGSCGDTVHAIERLCQISGHDGPFNALTVANRSAMRDVNQFNAQHPELAGSSAPRLANSPHPAVAAMSRALAQQFPGWPLSVAQTLTPGDPLYVYNGNTGDSFGIHQIIFMGWLDASHTQAAIVNGQWGCPINGCHLGSTRNMRTEAIVKQFHF